MKATKIFCIIAYDVAETKRRNKVIKLISPYGKRINFSVYECMMTQSQFNRLRLKLEMLLDRKTDQVAIYPICLDCYAKSVYIPEQREEYSLVRVYD